MVSARDRGSLGFRYEARKNGDVVISRHGHVCTTLRSAVAAEFLAEIAAAESDEAQQRMARLTGNYKRGNERLAATHPRNRR